jgi:hypothetical protein
VDFSQMNTRELYDFIRCREHPYPNAFMEDEFGMLSFVLVVWTPKE